jgi:dephospho-CoA kinase
VARLVGLTGGIGAGKSTVADALAERGAVIVDADRIARDVVEPGGAAYEAVVERFGWGILHPDGRLNRQALANIVFADDDARRDLNAITHPAIAETMARRVGEQTGTDRVVVLDIPLLTPETRDRWGLAGVIVVDAPVEVAVQRLVKFRGFDEADARARVDAQISREERRSLVKPAPDGKGPPGLLIDNAGDPEELDAQVDAAWQWIAGLPAANSADR